jgi:hypothetical protein
VLPPNEKVAGTKLASSAAIPVLALAPDLAQPAKPPMPDLTQIESDLGAPPQKAPQEATEPAKPDSDQAPAEQVSEAQAEQPKRSIGERFMRLFSFGKKDETQQAKVQEKPEPQPEQQDEQQSDQGQVEQTYEAQVFLEILSFVEVLRGLFSFGMKF